MHLLYYIPSDTTVELCKILKEMMETKENSTSSKKKNAEPYSEFTLRESIQTLKGLEVLADNKGRNIEFLPNNNNCLYEMRFQMTVEEGYPPVRKAYAVITKFEAICLNSDYEDITISIRMDPKAKTLNLMLFLPRKYLSSYRKREIFKGNLPVEVEYLAERKK